MDYSDLKYDMEEFESDQDKKLPQPPIGKGCNANGIDRTS